MSSKARSARARITGKLAMSCIPYASRWPRKKLCASGLGPYNFAGQYQQAPAPAGGGMLEAAWFPRYTPEDLPQKFHQIVQS